MVYELQSKFLKGGYIGDYVGDYYRGYMGHTTSLDYGSHADTLSSSSLRFGILSWCPSTAYVTLLVAWWRTLPKPNPQPLDPKSQNPLDAKP